MVTAKLISAFVFATRIVQSLYFLNPKFQASSSCTDRFVSDLVGDTEDRFSHNEAHVRTESLEKGNSVVLVYMIRQAGGMICLQSELGLGLKSC